MNRQCSPERPHNRLHKGLLRRPAPMRAPLREVSSVFDRSPLRHSRQDRFPGLGRPPGGNMAPVGLPEEEQLDWHEVVPNHRLSTSRVKTASGLRLVWRNGLGVVGRDVLPMLITAVALSVALLTLVGLIAQNLPWSPQRLFDGGSPGKGSAAHASPFTPTGREPSAATTRPPRISELDRAGRISRPGRPGRGGVGHPSLVRSGAGGSARAAARTAEPDRRAGDIGAERARAAGDRDRRRDRRSGHLDGQFARAAGERRGRFPGRAGRLNAADRWRARRDPAPVALTRTGRLTTRCRRAGRLPRCGHRS